MPTQHLEILSHSELKTLLGLRSPDHWIFPEDVAFEARLRLDLRRDNLAKAWGIPRSTMNNVCSGAQEPTWGVYDRFTRGAEKVWKRTHNGVADPLFRLKLTGGLLIKRQAWLLDRLQAIPSHVRMSALRHADGAQGASPPPAAQPEPTPESPDSTLPQGEQEQMEEMR